MFADYTTICFNNFDTAHNFDYASEEFKQFNAQYRAWLMLPEYAKNIYVDTELTPMQTNNALITMIFDSRSAFHTYDWNTQRSTFYPHKFNLKNGAPIANYYSVDNGALRYIPSNRVARYCEDPTTENYMKLSQTAKLAKIARMLFSEDALKDHGINDSVLEQYAYIIKAQNSIDMYDIETLHGVDILDGYLEDNYDTSTGSYSGTIFNSCMRYSRCQSYIRFYAGIANCSLLVARNKETHDIVARALLWNNVTMRYNGATENVTYLDRVYYTQDHLEKLFHNYAKKNGYCYFSSYDIVCNSSGAQLDNAKLSVETGYNDACDSYPYADTFSYLTEDFSTLTNYRGSYTLHSVDGDLEGYNDNYTTCDRCSARIDEDDANYTNSGTLCNYCYRESMVACHNCSEDIDSEEAEYVHGNAYCSTCYDETFYESRANDHGIIRREDAPIVVCGACEEETSEDHARYLSADNCYVCEACHNSASTVVYTQVVINGYNNYAVALRRNCAQLDNGRIQHVSTLQRSMF